MQQTALPAQGFSLFCFLELVTLITLYYIPYNCNKGSSNSLGESGGVLDTSLYFLCNIIFVSHGVLPSRFLMNPFQSC